MAGLLFRSDGRGNFIIDSVYWSFGKVFLALIGGLRSAWDLSLDSWWDFLLEVRFSEGVHFELVGAHSAIFIQMETLEDEIFAFGGDLNIRGEMYGLAQDLVSEFFLSVCLPGSDSVEHFVVDDSQTPDIALERVVIRFECLRAHVHWSSDVVIKLTWWRFNIFRKSKIS